MWIAVITGVHSRSFGLLEISLILTFGGSLVSFSCGWKSVSSSGRFCLQEGRWIPIPVRSSAWSEGSQWMRWKKSLNCNPRLEVEKEKMEFFSKQKMLLKYLRFFLALFYAWKKILFPDEKRPKLTLFYLSFKNVIDFLSPPNSIPVCISRQKNYVQATPMSCFFPGKDEPNARSPVQARARRGSCLRKRSLVLRNVVILITTNPENDIQRSF